MRLSDVCVRREKIGIGIQTILKARVHLLPKSSYCRERIEKDSIGNRLVFLAKLTSDHQLLLMI